MNPIVFTPSRRYFLLLFIRNLLAFGFSTSLVVMFMLSRSSMMLTWGSFLLVFGMSLIMLIFAFTWLHFQSIRYELLENEVVIYRGFFSQSVHHIPFRNITDFRKRYGFLDRLFELGSISIQTAGMGTPVAEGQINGIYQSQIETLHTFIQEQMTQQKPSKPTGSLQIPTLQRIRATRTPLNDDTMAQVLQELRAIRQELHRR
jgi:uncharacterized membrane protein YdbT with pleckstrin-like domain